MLTLEKLKKIKPGTIFATGQLIDCQGGLYVANTNKMLKWVATKGHGHDDWCIYCHFAEHDEAFIKSQGDKVSSKSNIRRCVPCDDEALALYRQ